MGRSGTRARIGPRQLLILVLAGLLLGVGAISIVRSALEPRRTTQVYEPPVLAGQQLWGACAGGFYARHGDTIVLTSTGHCTSEGTVAYDADGTTVRGVFGPAARDATCPYPGHRCAASRPDRYATPLPDGGTSCVDALDRAGPDLTAPGRSG